MLCFIVYELNLLKQHNYVALLGIQCFAVLFMVDDFCYGVLQLQGGHYGHERFEKDRGSLNLELAKEGKFLFRIEASLASLSLIKTIAMRSFLVKEKSSDILNSRFTDGEFWPLYPFQIYMLCLLE